MLLAMRKETWKEFRFNEAVLKGFEFYDIEICLRAQFKYKLVIDNRIFTEHFGKGRYNTKRWITDALDFYDHKAVKGYATLVGMPSPAFLEDFAFKRFLERIAGIDDSKWKLRIMTGMFRRFPALFLKNILFYVQVSRRIKNSAA
jgi:hypothetical protein